MNTETGGPAFPMSGFDTRHGQSVQAVYQHGMTLRDYFAAKAMQGMLASDIECAPEYVPVIVKSAYVLADAMLEERSKT